MQEKAKARLRESRILAPSSRRGRVYVTYQYFEDNHRKQG